MNEQFQATPDPSNYQHFHLRKEEDETVSREEGGRREKVIEITEYLCEPETMPLEDFITSCTIDALGVPLDPCEDASVFMPEKQIEQLRFLEVGASMPFGEPEAGLTIKRIK